MNLNSRSPVRHFLILGMVGGLLCAPPPARAAERSDDSDDVASWLADTGIQGGLVVHLGCGDGRLAAKIAECERFLVHGLDRDAENVRRSRQYIRSRGVYGRVTADVWEGDRLPYVDDLVNPGDR